MSQEDDSFNSNGATEVSFETYNTDGVPEFGVSVSSKTCGVYGQALGIYGPHDRRTAPTNTGVFGRAESHGVYGTTNSIGDPETPDFTGKFPGPGGAGVVGVSDSGPAVLADTHITGDNFSKNSAVKDMCSLNAGVASISVEGPAVLGVCSDKPWGFDADPDVAVTDIVKGLNPATQNEEPHIKRSGVIGIGAVGPGVRGVSVHERGGRF